MGLKEAKPATAVAAILAKGKGYICRRLLVDELSSQIFVVFMCSSSQASRPVMCVSGLVVISRRFLTRDWRSRPRALDTFHVASQLSDAGLDSSHA